MKTLEQFAFVAILLATSQVSTFAGQPLVAPVKDFYDGASLVAIVDVIKVTTVEVPTGAGQETHVYVAEAEVLQTLKSDLSPIPEKRRIVIVGSSIPLSSAAWRPLERQQHLAFLNPEQGHYRYGERYAMRPISPAGEVEWIEQNAKGEFELLSIDVDEAVKKIQSEQNGGGQPAAAPN